VKLARIVFHGRPREALVEDGGYVLRDGDDAGTAVAAGSVRLLPPAEPTKIIGIGWNFPEHIREMVARLPASTFPETPAEPIIFYKPLSSLVAHGEAIVYPRDATRVEHEGELVVVMGAPARRVDAAAARGLVRGWTCGNDVTERDMQRRDKQWWRAKGYDTFAAVGPYLETETPDASARIVTRVNGQVRQEGRVRDMLRDPFEIIAYVSQAVTLLPGDMIMLGTPPGVGELLPGDTVEVEVDGVGCLANPVVAE
jgi:2-keto-4-pentenoate hydratase/2-oxohepta-3-ene-1,7-dioic acid hydratase in catechol pathway